MNFLNFLVLGTILSVLTSFFPARADTNSLIDKVVALRGFSHLSMSPDHKYIAMGVYRDSSHGLALYDIVNRTQKLIVKPQRESDGYWFLNKQVHELAWVTNDLIAIDFGAVIESVNLDGRRVARLVESKHGVEIIGKANPRDPSSSLLLVRMLGDDDQILSVDARTGKQTIFDTPKDGKLSDWAFDAHGQLRALTLKKINKKEQKTTYAQWYRPSDKSPWIFLEENGLRGNHWTPIFVPDTENNIVVTSDDGRDTKAVFLYDTVKHKKIEMMAGHPSQDIISVKGVDANAFSRVTTMGLMLEQVWFDPTWTVMQAAIDKVLPERINVLSGDPKSYVLIHSYSDTDPGSWYILDVEKTKLSIIARTRPALQDVEGYKKHSLTYPSRDGYQIPAYLTLPKGKALKLSEKNATPLPLVVYIHGGPISRNHWNWEDHVQVLANEGYLVFQPQFRGSNGFGNRFEAAGYRQWGLSMQDDISEGVQYLIDQGIADPKKICIYGASYGGYAAMWGLVKTPTLYRCGVSVSGVADIAYMFADSSDTNSNQTALEIMRQTVGDISKDQSMFDAVSPLKHADKISAPLLLMHGEHDLRVPIAHSEKMKKALDKHKKYYECLEFEYEGHSIQIPENRKKYLTKLTEFLAKYLK